MLAMQAVEAVEELSAHAMEVGTYVLAHECLQRRPGRRKRHTLGCQGR